MANFTVRRRLYSFLASMGANSCRDDTVRLDPHSLTSTSDFNLDNLGSCVIACVISNYWRGMTLEIL